MDNLLKRISVKGQRMPPQKTPSFKGEKKKGQNWFKRTLSGNVNNKDYNSNRDMEHATAVAAAAYAINLLQYSGVPDEKRTNEAPEGLLTKLKSKKDTKTILGSKAGQDSNKYSGGSLISLEGTDGNGMVPVTVATDVKATKTAVDVAPAPAPSIQKTLFANGKSSEEAIDPAPAPAPAPPIKKIPTFDGKQLSSASSMKPEKKGDQDAYASGVEDKD